MFKPVQNPIYKNSSLFALVASCVFFSVFAQAFTLDTKSLSERSDHFSLLNKNIKYKELDDLIDSCQSPKRVGCLKKAGLVYIDPQFIFFRPLVVNLAVRALVKTKKPLRKISFLNKNELTVKEMRLIVRSYDAESIKKFFKADFFKESTVFRKTLLKQVSSLCKFSDMPAFSTSILKELSVQEDFYERTYSRFPCGLNLTGEWLELLEEIKASKGRSSHKHEYKFSFLKKKALNNAYRKFPKYKKRTLKYKKKHMWKKLVKAEPALQIKVVKNLFYQGRYELLGHAHTIDKKKIHKIPSEALEFLVKSLMTLGEYERALRLSDHVQPSSDQADEEIFLMRGGAYLRTGKWSQAEKQYKIILKNPIDLKLSALYWLRVSLGKQNKKSEIRKIDKEILKLYPFSYYGILVGIENKGPKFFEAYQKENFVKQSFVDALSPGDIEQLNFFYSYGHILFFKKAFKAMEEKMNPLQRALFALVFKNVDDQLEIIRSLNLVWDSSKQTRSEPFVSSSFPTPYDAEIKKAVKNGKYTNEALVYAVMRQESAFGESARSSSGARGLMQLLPSTARDVAKQIRFKKYKSARDLYKPNINIYLGSRYMDRLIRAGKGYLPYAFASYNAGPGRMYKWSKHRSEVTDLRQGLKKDSFDPIDELWIEELPWSETRFYTKALLRNMGIYASLKGNLKQMSCQPFWACDQKNL